MTRLLHHRGPDDEGFFEGEGVGLGMRRLSIIDVGGGHQPIHNEDESIWLVFNGEIYNHQVLRERLQAAGHHFYTQSDTECIVHLYEEDNEGFLQHLQGMFCFALWDKSRNRLVLARDRVGIKPLYYQVFNGRLYFASELKSLLVIPGYERKMDPVAVSEYLSLLYIPAPRTVFQATSKLPPATVLTLTAGELVVRSYWDLQFATAQVSSEEEAAERVLELLEESVRQRMISDVPLGAFLSGGLDSSAIVALMSRNSSGPVKTFTVDFEGEGGGFSEVQYARQVAREFDTEHHECRIDYDVVDLLPRVLWHFDEPFGNSTSVLTYLLSEYAQSHVTVALSGTGGDEAFLGYPRYLGLSLARTYEMLPSWIRRQVVEKVAGSLPESTDSGFPMDRLFKRLRRFVEGMKLPEEHRYMNWLTYFDAQGIRRLTGSTNPGPELASLIESFDHYAGRAVEDRAFYTDVKTFLPGNQLEYMDKMSMAHSLEARVPFCDHRLLELSASLRPEWKLRGGGGKLVLKKACEKILNKKVIYRRKVGFDAPSGAWIKGSLRPICESLFSEQALEQTGLLKAAEVQKLMASHLSGRRDLSNQLWSLLVLEVWYRMYVIEGVVDRPDFTLRDLLDQQNIEVAERVL